MKYTSAFFADRFRLTPLQAADYSKAFGHIQALLQQTNPFQKPMHRQFYAYEAEAFTILEALHTMGNKLKTAAILNASFPGFVKRRCGEAEQAARQILSIRDSYIWPAYTYDDWNKLPRKVNECRFSTGFLQLNNKPSKQHK